MKLLVKYNTFLTKWLEWTVDSKEKPCLVILKSFTLPIWFFCFLPVLIIVFPIGLIKKQFSKKK